MKIIQFIDSMYTGGAETLVCNTALEMNKQGMDVDVLCLSTRRSTPNESALDNARVKTVYMGDECVHQLHLERFMDTCLRHFAIILLLIPVYRKTVINETPDVLHMHLDALLLYPFIPRKIKAKCRSFWTIHSDPDVFLKTGVLSAFRRRILKHNPDINVLLLNREGQDKFTSYKLANKTGVIRNGIDIDKYRIPKDRIDSMRMELGISKDAFVIGHIGRFGDGEAVKNQSFLVDVFDWIRANDRNAYLLLVGGGEPSEKLFDKIRDGANSGHIVALSNRSDVPELLSIMDVFVLPSVYEGFPMTLIEAQAAGLRCVVSDAVTKEAALTDRICYLPLSAGESTWADAIIRPIKSEQPRGRLQDYDIKNVVQDLISVYKGTGKGSL